jgi:hypothetical protein
VVPASPHEPWTSLSGRKRLESVVRWSENGAGNRPHFNCQRDTLAMLPETLWWLKYRCATTEQHRCAYCKTHIQYI